MISTDFQNETAGTTVQDSPRWNLPTGATSGLTFVREGTVKVAPGTGKLIVVHATGPAFPHQSVEVSLNNPASPSVTCHIGFVLQYVDTSNYVVCYLDHSTGIVKAYQVVNGTPSLLGSIADGHENMLGSSFDPAIRCEIIGSRLRLWYDRTPAVPSRPPDMAATLSSVATGSWGLYANTSGTNDARITRFEARDMPSAVAPPPHLSVVDASGLELALVPITVTLSGVSADAMRVEWQVFPVDAGDFPEAYTDATTFTERVLFVRPGYTYDVRVREVHEDGYSAWTEFSRVTAPGTPSVESDPVLPTLEFPDIAPDYVLPQEASASVNAEISETGRERVHSPWKFPRRTFRLSFVNRLKGDIQDLIDFFDECRGKNMPFTWTHPTTGDQFAMRFDNDDYSIKYEDQGNESTIASFSLDIIEVWLGSVSTININLGVDQDITVDGDQLIEKLNDLANTAQLSEYAMVRTGDPGEPLTYQEFNELSENLAYLSQYVYVGEIEDPDSFVNYQYVTLSADNQVDQSHLMAIYNAQQQMKYLRRPIVWGSGTINVVTITHATWSEANCATAWGMVPTYWGTNTTTTSGGFGVVSTNGSSSDSPAYLARFKRGAGGDLEVTAATCNTPPTFDFSPWSEGALAKVFVRCRPCNPVDTPTDVDLPSVAFNNQLVEGQQNGKWVSIASLDSTVFGTEWSDGNYPDPLASVPVQAPLGYPASNNSSYVMGWIVDEAVVLIEVDPAVED